MRVFHGIPSCLSSLMGEAEETFTGVFLPFMRFRNKFVRLFLDSLARNSTFSGGKEKLCSEMKRKRLSCLFPTHTQPTSLKIHLVFQSRAATRSTKRISLIYGCARPPRNHKFSDIAKHTHITHISGAERKAQLKCLGRDKFQSCWTTTSTLKWHSRWGSQSQPLTLLTPRNLKFNYTKFVIFSKWNAAIFTHIIHRRAAAKRRDSMTNHTCLTEQLILMESNLEWR